MSTHDLKCWPIYFEPVLAGSKKFEVRRDDRGFKPGDVLQLREFVPCEHCHGLGAITVERYLDARCPTCEGLKGTFTGRVAERHVVEVFGRLPGVERGHVVMSLRNGE